MSVTESILTIAGCALAIGFALGWLARVLIGELLAQRGSIEFDEVYRQFTEPQARARDQAEDFDWFEPA